MLSRILVLAALLVVCLSSFVLTQPDRSPMSRLLAERERVPMMDIYRFLEAHSGPQKRNNAEVVNHILKNFGTLDRLGDVGK